MSGEGFVVRCRGNVVKSFETLAEAESFIEARVKAPPSGVRAKVQRFLPTRKDWTVTEPGESAPHATAGEHGAEEHGAAPVHDEAPPTPVTHGSTTAAETAEPPTHHTT